MAAALSCAWLATAAPVPAEPGLERPVTFAGPGAEARPTVTLDDVLSMETFGSTALSPDGRWVVYERRRPYDSSSRFDRAHRSGYVVTDLMIAPVDGSRLPEALVRPETGRGILFGGWSPDGRRLLIYRLEGDRLEAGLVTFPDRRVRWTGLVPDLPLTGAGHSWLDGDRLALTIRPDGSLPWSLRFDSPGSEAMTRRWQQTVEGQTPSRLGLETRGGRLTSDAAPTRLAVVVLDERTGEQRQVADGLVRDVTASPRGDWLAITLSGQTAPTDPSGLIIQSAVQRRTRLSLVEVRTGRTVQASPALDVAPNLLRWSPDGQAVLIWGRQDGQAWQAARLRAIYTDGRERLFETEDLLPLAEGFKIDELQAVQADWLGEQAVLRARRPGSDRRDWWQVGAGAPVNLTEALASPPARLAAVSPDHLRAFADGRLWSIADGGGLTALTPASDVLTDGQTHTLMETPRPRVNSPPRQAWVVARSPGDSRIVGDDGRVGVRSTASECGGTLQGRSATADALVTACLDQGVETLRLATPEGDRVLDQVNPGFARLAIPQAQAVPHRDHLDRPTTSYLFMPPGLAADRVKGVLVLVYPGVVDDGRYVEATSLGLLGPRAQILASEGYAVLSAALPPEEDSTRETMIADFVRNTDLAVDATLSLHPGLPEDRMAVIGHSFGGYVTLAIATQSDRFRSYVAWAGVTDLASKWGELTPHHRVWPSDHATLDFAIGATEVGQARMGGPPWSDVEGYAAASPFMRADRIKAPLLLITADRDYVTMTQSELMLSAMHRQGGWARLVTYWGEGHSNASPANIRDAYREIFDWLDRTLAVE